jgi:hypothetical protein
VPALINQLLSIKVNKAKQFVFEEVNPMAFAQYNLNLTKAELELFFGIVASEAKVSFEVYGAKGYETINAHSDLLLLGGTYACGAVRINCSKNKNEVYRLKEKELDFTVIDIKNALESKGFSRIKFTYDVAASQLWFTFYTE